MVREGPGTRRSVARARERRSGDTAAAVRRPHPGRRTPLTHGAAPPLRPAATLSKWRFGDRRVTRANVPSRSDGANRPSARFGLIAQRESVRLTRGRSLVRSQLGPPSREGPDQENPRQGLFRGRTGFELDPIAPSAAVTREGGCRRAGPSLCSGRVTLPTTVAWHRVDLIVRGPTGRRHIGSSSAAQDHHADGTGDFPGGRRRLRMSPPR